MTITLREDLVRPLTTAELDGNFKTLVSVDATKVDKVTGKQLSTEDFTTAEKAKLAATDIYTTAEKSKLASLEGSHFRGSFTSEAGLVAGVASPKIGDYADVDEGIGKKAMRYIWDSTDANWVKSGAADPITAAQVKQLYESNPDTNAFTNLQKTKLTGIADNATKNQTDSFLLNRANHTGTQPASTVTGLQTAALTRTVIRSGSLNVMGTPGLYMVIPDTGTLEGAPVLNGVPRTSGYLDITTSTEPINGVLMTQQVWHAHLNSQKWTRWLVANGTSWTSWVMSLFEGDFGITGKLSKITAGTNANSLPDYTHRIWLGSDSAGGPVAGQHWIIDHCFLQSGYAVQQAQQLGAEYPGVYTRSQANGVWGEWKQSTTNSGSGLPVGALVPWHISEASLPAGHIPANGQLLQRSVWPDLWALVAAVAVTDAQWLADASLQSRWSNGDGSTTFRAPDINGKNATGLLPALMLRGYGRRSSGYPGNAQLDQLGPMKYVNSTYDGVSTGNVSNESLPVLGTPVLYRFNGNAQRAPVDAASDGKTWITNTGNETRSANVAVIWCFIGGTVATNPGTVDITATAAQVASQASQIQNLQASAPKKWVSDWRTFAANVTSNFTHNLGVMPTGIWWQGRLKIATHGYSAGHVISIPTQADPTQGAGFTAWNIDKTDTLSIQTNSNANLGMVHVAGSGSQVQMPWSSIEIRCIVIAV